MPLHDIQYGVWPIPVAARSEAWVCSCSRTWIVGSNPAAGMERSVSCEYCVLSSRGLCTGMIIRPEESYGVGCV